MKARSIALLALQAKFNVIRKPQPVDDRKIIDARRIIGSAGYLPNTGRKIGDYRK